MNRPRFTLALAATLLAGAFATAPGAVAKPSAASTKPAPAAHAVVPFIDDDLDRALAEAKRRDLPLFVESWAPW